MKRGLTGDYQIIAVGDKRLRAFIPFPLPPRPPLDLTGSRAHLLEKATLALGRLDSVSVLLPDPNIFLYSYVRREAVLSSQIEGTQSSLSDLLLFEIEGTPGAPVGDVVEVSNYVSALNHGLARLREGFPFCNRLIREMHAKLLSSGRGSEKQPGEFRRTQNWIGGTRPENAHFVPPPPNVVERCMADLEGFLHDRSSPYPTVVRAGLAHAQFETIHPFLDGNGRIGRLLIAFILHHEGVLKQPLLYLSLYFKQNRNEYYRRLDLVRVEGDWEAWLDFFLEGVLHTAQNAVETAQRLVALFKEDSRKIDAQGRIANTALRIFNLLCQRPLTTLTKASKQTGLTFPAVAKGMETLVRLGIAKEVSGRKRDRVFAYDRYLAILNEGTEPM